MKKFFNKLAKTFIGIVTSIVLFSQKMYALTPLYGPVMPVEQPKPTFWEVAGKLLRKILISPITILVIVLIGVMTMIVYLVKGKKDKRTKILIVFAVILIFCVIILPLYLLIRAG